MGLDMYLYKKTYVKYWEHNGNNNYEVSVTKGGKPTNIDPMKVAYIVEEVGYWRKANQIHRWFVENVQDGVDNCGEYFVSRDDLTNLLVVCKEVRFDHLKAEELLPSAEGFFFGSTEYDEYYFQDIEDTINMLEGILTDKDADSFTYTSSW
jgi:hypothetical protein